MFQIPIDHKDEGEDALWIKVDGIVLLVELQILLNGGILNFCTFTLKSYVTRTGPEGSHTLWCASFLFLESLIVLMRSSNACGLKWQKKMSRERQLTKKRNLPAGNAGVELSSTDKRKKISQ